MAQEPFAIYRDGAIYRRGIWTPVEAARSLRASLQTDADNPADYFRATAADFVRQLTTAIEQYEAAKACEPLLCGLCGASLGTADVSEAVRETAGYHICCQCLEDIACDATAFNA